MSDVTNKIVSPKKKRLAQGQRKHIRRVKQEARATAVIVNK